MTEPPKECRDEINKISNPELRKIPAEWKSLEIDPQCIVHHFVHENFWPENQEKPNPETFKYPGLSVCVEGGPFGEFDAKAELIHFRNTTGKPFIGAVCFTVADLKASEGLDFKFMHDPHPFKYKPDEQWKTPPRNHAQIVCRKKTFAREMMLRLCRLSVRPDEFR